MLSIMPMTPADIPEALALWAASEGVSLRDADSPDALTRYLQRNPGMSFVARSGPSLAGVALAGHDGRRGILHHVAVAAPFRKRGIGRAIVEHCLAALKREGIQKCNILVFEDNVAGKNFWNRLGWREREGLQIMSFLLGDSENA